MYNNNNNGHWYHYLDQLSVFCEMPREKVNLKPWRSSVLSHCHYNKHIFNLQMYFKLVKLLMLQESTIKPKKKIPSFVILNTWGISLSSVTFLRVWAWSSPTFFFTSIITINIIFFRVLLLSSLLNCSTQLSFTGMNDAKTAICNGHSIITSLSWNIIECTLKEFELCPGERIPEKDCWWVTDVSTS